jgi:hypothetical protein
MGFAFPVGMIAYGEENKPWFWAVNGASSVLASVFSLVLAMRFGFSTTVLIGAALYMLAWVLLQMAKSQVAAADAAGDSNSAARGGARVAAREAAE